MNEVLEENKSLHERLSQLQEQPQSQTISDAQINDTSSLSSLGPPVEDTPQLQNGFVDKIIVRIIFTFNEIFIKTY